MGRLILISLVILGAIGAALFLTQGRMWLTGRGISEPLALVSGGPAVAPVSRIWIDTDAACGATPRTDPDDCLAILWLAASGVDIVGISTSFGNASGEVVERTVTSLMTLMTKNGMEAIPFYRGLWQPLPAAEPSAPGVSALRAALEAGPLTILALGPLTNISAALDGHPEMQLNVTRVVAVMGHRPGHLFHPGEGQAHGALFGHGPIFSDLNFSKDVPAAKLLLSMRLLVTLIPYDAAREVMLTKADLEAFARQGPVFASLASKSQDWLAFWNDEVGLPGFYPFDLVAAGYLAHPTLFDCAKTTAGIAREWTFWVVPHESLLVPADDVVDLAELIYCPKVSRNLHDVLVTGLQGP